MPDFNGKSRLLRIKQVWLLQRLLVGALLAVAIAIIVSAVFHAIFLISFYWVIPLAALIFISHSFTSRWWKLTEWDVARFLNQYEPTLQESSELLLQATESLPLLQRLQQQRTATILSQLSTPQPSRKRMVKAGVFFLMAMLVSVLLLHLPGKHLIPQTVSLLKTPVKSRKQSLPPAIKAINLTIVPPAYTGQPGRKQKVFDIQIAEGGSVKWIIETTENSKVLQLLFNDGTTVKMMAVNKRQNFFTAQRTISKSGFYQVKMDDTLSGLYKIEVVKDKPPIVAIQTPKPAVTVGLGQSKMVPLQVALSDDYGVKMTSISATVFSGEGEAVKFKQQTLQFDNFAAGKRQYLLRKNLDLKALGMEPGNELYFFITATDSHHQETRSDVYIITLEDTTVEGSMEGMVNGLNVKPDLFRSERQIIIETEQLLQDRSKISPVAFQQKCDDLGIDQKLLRLRYGKFLGEETDTEIGGRDHNDESKNGTDGATEILEQYGHSHDNAEDATFFDAATKKQLKETLAEMWKAELQLRTYKPKEALVFEYKALRLLKDLQQKSRAYVAKTGFTPTPLKMEKRLTGELNAIAQPVLQQQFEANISPEIAVRKAIAELEQLKNIGILQPMQKTLLQQAFQQLSSRAAQAPALYLPALSSFQKILSGNFWLYDINTAQNGLQKMLNPPGKLPFATYTNGDRLSTQYFNNLSGGGPRK